MSSAFARSVWVVEGTSTKSGLQNVEVELRGTNSAHYYKDIYMEQQELPILGTCVQPFKEPIGLEEDESDCTWTTWRKSCNASVRTKPQFWRDGVDTT